jgi:hypothetical protein
MAKKKNELIVPDEVVMNKIYIIKGQKVMIDRDLAELYGVETKVLKQAVRRNINRFPTDFMFEMSKKEFANWRSQNVTSKEDRLGLKPRSSSLAIKKMCQWNCHTFWLTVSRLRPQLAVC